MTDGTPARIDRAALERIIQRAAELQTSEHDMGESLTSDEVLALGREVGIPGRYLQQALLEEQTRIVSAGPGGVVERLTGPSAVTAQRVVRAEREAIERDVADRELEEDKELEGRDPEQLEMLPSGQTLEMTAQAPMAERQEPRNYENAR